MSFKYLDCSANRIVIQFLGWISLNLAALGFNETNLVIFITSENSAFTQAFRRKREGETKGREGEEDNKLSGEKQKSTKISDYYTTNQSTENFLGTSRTLIT